jgi:hypothetical protein
MAQDWAPMLPRDMEAETNLSILEKQAGLKSTETHLEQRGEVEDPRRELQRIEDDMKRETAAQTPPTPFGQQGAKTDNQAPVARAPTD